MNVNFKTGVTAKVYKMGVRGKEGRKVEMSSTGSTLLWRYEGDVDWQVLVDIGDLLPDADREQIIAALGFEPARADHTHPNATTTLAGFMSAADKGKLNAIENGAEKNVVLSVAGEVGVVTTARLIEVLGIRPSTEFATAAQGLLADTAVQPAAMNTALALKLNRPNGNVSQLIDGTGALQQIPVVVPQVQVDWNLTSGIGSILNRPALGTAAARPITDFATAAQGLLASTALQPADSSRFATAAQGLLADSAVQPATLAGYALVGHTHPVVTSAAAGFMAAVDKVKLDTIATGATQNSTDAQLRDRATHTGQNPISAVSGLQPALDALTTSVNGKLDTPTGTINQVLDGTGTPRDMQLIGEPIVIVASGQSNMAMVIDEPTNNFEYASNLHYWNFAGWVGERGTEFRRLLPTETSTAMAFGNQVALANPTSQVYVICVALGGQSITIWSDNLPIAGRTCLFDNVDLALAAINHPAGKPVDYFLWWQGESDAAMLANVYNDEFAQWTTHLEGRNWYDAFDTTNVMYAIADSPHIYWEDYTHMNRTLKDIVITQGNRYVWVEHGDMAEARYWTDEVHMSAIGYWLLGKRAWKTVTGKTRGASFNRYIKEDLLTRSTELTGNGLRFPDYPITWNQDVVEHSNGRMLNIYKEDYVDGEMVGLSTAGVGTYSRTGVSYTRVGNVIFFTGVIQWEAHTGTGQLAFNRLPLQNYFGAPVNVAINFDNLGDAQVLPIVAQWQMWTDQIMFYEQQPDGNLTPFNVPPVGRVSMTGSFIRLREI